MTQQKHSTFGGSSAERWLSCIGSVNPHLQDRNTSNAYAEEGTKLHDVKNLPEPYYLFLKNLVVEEVINYEEQLTLIPDVAWGTADATIPELGIIIDLKTGYNKPKAINNPQLAFYAVAFAMKYNLTEVTAYIYHLPTESYEGWTLKQDDLSKWQEKFVNRITFLQMYFENKISITCSPYNPDESYCKYCPKLSSCPEVNRITMTIHEQNMTIDGQNKPDFYKILKEKKLIEAYLNAVESDAILRLSSGENIQGLQLKKGRTIKSWALSEKEVKAKLVEAGIQPTEEKLISPYSENIPAELIEVKHAKSSIVIS